MSAAPLRATARPISPARTPETQRVPRPHLRAVAAPEPGRSIVPFAWACLTVIMVALASVLALNTTMAEGAYEARELKIEIANLHQERAAALTGLEANAAPSALATRAQALGMVPANRIGYVRLADAQILAQGAGQ